MSSYSYITDVIVLFDIYFCSKLTVKQAFLLSYIIHMSYNIPIYIGKIYKKKLFLKPFVQSKL